MKEICPGCQRPAKLETHHFYPVFAERDGFESPAERKCRRCHSKIPKLPRTKGRWQDQWVRQLVHNTDPRNQEAYRLGDRSALIQMTRTLTTG